MEDARGETNILLELLLDPAAPGALLKDHLLVYLILSKGIGGDQISSAKEKPRLVRPQSLGSVPTVTRQDFIQQGLDLLFAYPAQLQSLSAPASPHVTSSAHWLTHPLPAIGLA